MQDTQPLTSVPLRGPCRSRSSSRLIVGELPDVVHAAAVKSKIVSYYKDLQWFTLAPIPSDTRHTAG